MKQVLFIYTIIYLFNKQLLSTEAAELKGRTVDSGKQVVQIMYLSLYLQNANNRTYIIWLLYWVLNKCYLLLLLLLSLQQTNYKDEGVVGGVLSTKAIRKIQQSISISSS